MCIRDRLVVISYLRLSLPPAVFPSLRLPPLANATPCSSPVCFYANTPCTRRTSTSLLFASLALICLLRPRASSLYRYATGTGRTHREFGRTSSLTPDCSKGTTVPHHSYGLTTTVRGEGGVVGKARKARHQLQHKGNGIAVYPKGRLRTANLGPCPRAYASHLFLIARMTLKNAPIPCRPVAIACIATAYHRRKTRRYPCLLYTSPSPRD